MSETVFGKLISAVTPVKFLVIVNIVCAGMDFVRAILTAAILGPEMYGIAAVLAGIHMTVLSLMEFSMSDLSANLYYNTKLPPGPELRSYRGSVVQICVLAQGAATALFIALGTLATLLTINLFTETPVRLMWIVANAAALGLKYWTSAFDYVKRFSERFYLTGSWRFVGVSASVAIFMAIILKQRDLNGFFIASFYSTLANFLIQAILTVFIWVKYEGFRLLGKDLWASAADFKGKIGFMFSGYMVSYSRLLHLSTDVLFVGYFCNDAVTGIYKLARSLTDRLSLFTDAMSQVYLPQCLDMLAKKSREQFAALAAKQSLLMLLATAALMAGGALVFPLIIKSDIMGFGKYAGVEASIVVLTIPFFFRAGMYMWMWPMFVSASKLNEFAIAAFIGDFFQYAVAAVMFKAIAPSPVVASVGFAVYYMTAFPICMIMLSRRFPGYMPGPGSLFKKRAKT